MIRINPYKQQKNSAWEKKENCELLYAVDFENPELLQKMKTLTCYFNQKETRVRITQYNRVLSTQV